MAGAFLAIAGGERGILFPALALGRQDPTKLARNRMNTGDSNFLFGLFIPAQSAWTSLS